MTINYNWFVSNMKTVQTPNPNFVSRVDWICSASNGEIKSGVTGSLVLEPSQGSFVPFEQLTEEVVISWVKEKLGFEMVSEYEAALEEKIESFGAPPTEEQNAAIPWAQS